jgi:hypothetical protein
MENVAVVFWVVLFVAIPAVALLIARRQRMERHAEAKSAEPHRPHGHHRVGH